MKALVTATFEIDVTDWNKGEGLSLAQKELKVSYVQAVSIINLIKQAIQTREREISEEVEKMIPAPCNCGCGSSVTKLILEKVLSIINNKSL